jgi:hypothetical protein
MSLLREKSHGMKAAFPLAPKMALQLWIKVEFMSLVIRMWELLADTLELMCRRKTLQ